MIVGGGFFVISFFMVSFLCCRCGHNAWWMKILVKVGDNSGGEWRF